jgi:hypothetical protein
VLARRDEHHEPPQHARVDALGNPVDFFLTGGQTHDLAGADHLLPSVQADTLIADKAFAANQLVLDPLLLVVTKGIASHR